VQLINCKPVSLFAVGNLLIECPVLDDLRIEIGNEEEEEQSSSIQCSVADPNNKYLSLHDYPRISDSGDACTDLVCFLEQVSTRGFKTLYFTNMDAVFNYTVFDCIITHYPLVSCLSTYDIGTDFTLSGLQSLLLHCKHLIKLELGFCFHLSANELIELFKTPNKISELSILGQQDLTVDDILSILRTSRPNQITKLRCQMCPLIDQFELEGVLKKDESFSNVSLTTDKLIFIEDDQQ
jgi:hypothetical protein